MKPGIEPHLGTGQHSVPPNDSLRTAQYDFSGIPATDAWPDSGHEETMERPRLRVILENKRPVFFKTVKDTRDRKRLRNHSRLKDIKET